jgi:hypothetical protein
MGEAIGAAAEATAAAIVAVAETGASLLASPTRPGLTLRILLALRSLARSHPGPLAGHPLQAASLANPVHGPSGTIAISQAATTRM